MKDLKTDSNNLYICEICGKKYKRFCDLSKHIGLNHNQREYYDLYLKEDNEGICSICGNETEYLNRWDRGYKKTCSKQCQNKSYLKQSIKTNLKKYGVKNVQQDKEIRIQTNKTNFKKYGNKCPMVNDEIQEKVKNTLYKNYGVDNPFKNKILYNKARETQKIRYGAKYTFQSKILNDKIIKTNLLKYGVENVMQSPEIFNKQFSNLLKNKLFRDTNLYFQSSYELDFLERYYNKIDIINGPSIPYVFEGKNKVYHSDFYIPSLNLVIEIKSLYYRNLYGLKNKEKEKATISNGFNFIMILNKDYKYFNEYLNSLIS